MAVVADPNRGRPVARPPWVRRHENQHEGVVAGIMLTLVIVGIAVFLFWGPLLRFVASSPLFEFPDPQKDRPAEGAAPPGPPVVVTLDSPALPASAPATPAPNPPDQLVVADPALAAALAGAPGAEVAESDQGEAHASAAEAQAAAEAAAARDADETARAAEEARSAEGARAAATPAPTARPLATPTVAAPTATTRSAAAASGPRARVYRTGGRGVVLYSAPRQGARLPAGLLEGTVVSVLGVSGEWTQVEGAGKSGWVKSEFLTPAE